MTEYEKIQADLAERLSDWWRSHGAERPAATREVLREVEWVVQEYLATLPDRDAVDDCQVTIEPDGTARVLMRVPPWVLDVEMLPR